MLDKYITNSRFIWKMLYEASTYKKTHSMDKNLVRAILENIGLEDDLRNNRIPQFIIGDQSTPIIDHEPTTKKRKE